MAQELGQKIERHDVVFCLGFGGAAFKPRYLIGQVDLRYRGRCPQTLVHQWQSMILGDIMIQLDYFGVTIRP